MQEDTPSELKRLEAEVSQLHALTLTMHGNLELLGAELSKLHGLTLTMKGNLDRLNRWRDRQLRLAADPKSSELQDAFNGQLSKSEIFRELVAAGPMRVAVETGTFKGWTTRHLAGVFRHVVTFENDIANINQAKQHCEIHPNISFVHGDSTLIERAWTDIPIPLDEVDFVYLDAHWGDHCPLPQELDFLLGQATNAIIFIDDFKVEDDPDYGYDVYSSMSLDFNHIEEVLKAHDPLCFYPRRRGLDDTSIYYADINPRGTLVLAPRARGDVLREAKTIRPAR